jgi:hypothetical protein
MDYFINEGNRIGGQEPQALGSAQARITASVEVTKGMVVESTGDWTVGPAGAKSVKVVGIAANNAKVGENVVVETEGFVKLQSTAVAIVAGTKLTAGANGTVQALVDTGDVIGVAFAGCDASAPVYTKIK